MAWNTPKTDWDTNPKSPMAEDFNRIEENIEFLNNDIETKKGVIVDALNTVGIATLISDTHVQIASKITGAKKTGVNITPGTVNKAIPNGIYDTLSGVVVGDPDLVPANIKADTNIFGVVGNYDNGGISKITATNMNGIDAFNWTDFVKPAAYDFYFRATSPTSHTTTAVMIYIAGDSSAAWSATATSAILVREQYYTTWSTATLTTSIPSTGNRHNAIIYNPDRASITFTSLSGYGQGSNLGYYIIT